jgi:3-oxoacyl-[acyl-carrier protein] reductase
VVKPRTEGTVPVSSPSRANRVLGRWRRSDARRRRGPFPPIETGPSPTPAARCPGGSCTTVRLMETGLSGHGVLVTGGAGGIGAAVVRTFADEGARIAIHYHTSEAAANQLAEDVGGVALQADLTIEEEADALISDAARGIGRLDVCVANAGVWPSEDLALWDLPVERWEATLRANLTATFLTARAFLRYAAGTGSGSLVMVGSTAGVFGEAGHADYAAAKGGILTGLLLSAKNEAARIGVRVNAVAPGWTVTPMTTEAREDPALERRVTATMALKKLGTPEDVARQVVVLASDRLSGHVTGQVVVVAGGMEGRLLQE